jgi:prevent-host-death family protein
MEAAYTMGLTEAKNKFNALAEEVNRTGTAVTVYKRNKPFVTIIPAGTLTFNDETLQAIEDLRDAPVYRDAGELFEALGI